MADTCVTEAQLIDGLVTGSELTIAPPPGLEGMLGKDQAKAVPHEYQELVQDEYAVGDRVRALRSSGSWSEGTIVEVLSDKVIVMLKPGNQFKQIRKDLVPKLLKKVQPVLMPSVQAQLFYRMAEIEIEHAQLSYAHSVMQMQAGHPHQEWDANKRSTPDAVPRSGCAESAKAMSDGCGETASTASFGSSLESSSDVPASFGSSLDNSSDGQGELTTVMMRNIPNSLTRSELLKLMDNAGFRGHYDLFYLPIDLKNKCGLGYAFANFVHHDFALAFSKHFNGFNSWNMQSEKVCEVTWSKGMQGLNEHVSDYRDSPVMHESVPDEYRPVLFKNGARVPFPPPTKNLRAPRIWSRRR